MSKTGNGKAIVAYKPLVKCIDFHQNEYFTTASYEKVKEALDSRERIDFDFSGDCVKTSHIVRHRLADPEEVLLAWKIQQLTYWQKEGIRAGIKLFHETWNYSKALTELRIDAMIENVKAGKPAYAPNTNNK